MMAVNDDARSQAGGADLDGMEKVIRDHFLGWQCRLRQHSIRNLNGQPSTGMAPDIVVGDSDTGYEGVTVLLDRQDPAEFVPEFRHMVRKTRDPKQRYDNALKYFAEVYYQDRNAFTDRMTALFKPGSVAAERLGKAGAATLVFEEKNQRYVMPCKVRRLADDDPSWQATYWHNHLFNPNLAGDSIILQFVPDWANAKADPPVY